MAKEQEKETVKEPVISYETFINSFILNRAERYYYDGNFNDGTKKTFNEWSEITKLKK